MIVSTDAPNPTTGSYGWTWAGNRTELLVNHQDPNFKQGWFYVGVICMSSPLHPCPAYYGLQVTQRVGFNVRQGQHALKFGPHGTLSKWKLAGKMEELNSKTFTVEYWVKLNSEFCPDPDPCQTGWTLFDNSVEFVHKIAQRVKVGDDGITMIKYGKLVMEYGGTGVVETEFEPPIGEWFHIATPYNFETKVLQVFVNGVEVASFTVAIRRMPGLDIYLGGPNTGAKGLDGNIDEFRLWTTARTSAEIAADWQSYFGGPRPGLTGYWRFNEGSGTNSYSLTVGLGQEILTVNGQDFEYLDLFKGVNIGSVAWTSPTKVYAESSTVTPAGSQAISGETPRLWPEYPEALWDNPQIVKDGKILWQEICLRNFTDWRIGVNVTMTARTDSQYMELMVSHNKGPDTDTVSLI